MLFTNGIISFTSVLQYLSKTVTMVHTSKVEKPCKGYSSEILQQDTPTDSVGHHNPDEKRRTWNCGRDR